MFELRMEITLQSYFIFARHCDVSLLHYNCVIYLFDVVTFELRLEKNLQLHYVFARHCGVTLQLRSVFAPHFDVSFIIS